MRSARLLAVAALAIVLGLSSAQNVFAAQIFLSPTCGPPGTKVYITGSSWTPGGNPMCDILSTPGLVGPTRGTNYDCAFNYDVSGSVSGWFIVQAGARGSYSVTVFYNGKESAPTEFSTDCPCVGGVVMPADTLAMFAPWVAVIGLVGCIATAAVVAKKRRS